MTNYRIDYTPDAAAGDLDAIVAIPMSDRRRAMAKARQISARRDVSSCYAIATRDGKDVGQRVYSYGSLSHQDGVF